MKKYLNTMAIAVILSFLLNTLGPVPMVQADDFHLPAPGTMVQLSPAFNPIILKGIKVDPNNPFHFDFILDQGDNSLPPVGRPVLNPSGSGAREGDLKQESTKLIKYFLASLTIPEKDLWVNLSPYEKDRIIPPSFGKTEMGRDLLAEDYMLKQITASLIYPEGDTGKKFWKRIYEEAAKKFGTTNIPVNTFNKVWIVPDKAVVYENIKAGTAYVVEAKLKVMLEEDYLSMQKHKLKGTDTNSALRPIFGQELVSVPVNTNQLGSNIIREILIPQLTKEINEGKNFAQLRQVYNSLILATWYKNKIKDSILAQVYENENKVTGVGYGNSLPPVGRVREGGDINAIYQRYLQAFKKGAYNYIKEEVDPVNQQTTPRKYFSGGCNFAMLGRSGLIKMIKDPRIARFVIPSVQMVLSVVLLASAGKFRNDRLFQKFSYLEYQVYLYSYIGLNWWNLPKETQEFIKFIGVQRLINVVKASGNGSRFLFEFGWPALWRMLSPEELRIYWPGLAEMAIAVKEQSGYLFKYQLPLIWKNNTIDRDEWLKLVHQVKSTGVFAAHQYLIRQDLLRRLKEWISAEITIMGPKKGHAFEYGMFLAGKFITNNGDFDRWRDKWQRIIGYFEEDQIALLSQYFSNGQFLKRLNDMTVGQLNNRYDVFNLILESGLTPRQKDEILVSFLEPAVFSSPEALTLPVFNRIAQFYQSEDNFKYFLYYVSQSGASEDVKTESRRLLENKYIFKLHKQISEKLKNGRKNVLIVPDMFLGVGDELVPAGAIIQGLLDFNPNLHITVVTDRGNLYAHPRITPVKPQDSDQVRLDQKDFDAVFDTFSDNEPSKLKFKKYLVQIENSFNASVFVRLNRDEWAYETVRIGTKEYAHELNLNRGRVFNVYEPTMRLLAEFGLPIEVGAPNGSFLTAIDNPAAREEWDKVMHEAGNEKTSGGYKYKSILLNLYGGAFMNKGVDPGPQAQGSLIKQIERFVTEGYKVVILPNGTPWGTQKIAKQLRIAVPEQYRSHVVVVPELNGDASREIDKYFIQYADKIYTVEGGMVHLSTLMGKDYDVVKTKGSGTMEWDVFARNPRQRILGEVPWGFPAVPNTSVSHSLLASDTAMRSSVEEEIETSLRGLIIEDVLSWGGQMTNRIRVRVPLFSSNKAVERNIEWRLQSLPNASLSKSTGKQDYLGATTTQRDKTKIRDKMNERPKILLPVQVRSFADAINYIIQVNGWPSIRFAAAELDESYTALKRYLQGYMPQSRSTIYRWAMKLDVNPDELLRISGFEIKNPKTLGEAIEDGIERNGETFAEAAARLGVSVSTVNRYSKADTLPAETIYRIALRLRMDVNTLLELANVRLEEPKTFPEAIMQVRIKRGLTRKEADKLFNSSISNMKRIEDPEFIPNQRTVEFLINGYGIKGEERERLYRLAGLNPAMMTPHDRALNGFIPVTYTYERALSFFESMVKRPGNGGREVPGLIRMSDDQSRILMVFSNRGHEENSFSHEDMIKRVSSVGYSGDNAHREWISIILGWDDEGKLNYISLFPPTINETSKQYSNKMLSFRGVEKDREEVREEMINIVRLIRKAAIHQGIDINKIPIEIAVEYFPEFDKLSNSLQEIVDLPTRKDRAMESSLQKGGIDLNPDKMNLQTKMDSGNGIGIQFHIDPAMLEKFQDAAGFVPVIVDMKRVTDLKEFLNSPIS